ncbi:MAG: hypothetical protein IKH99_01765 [Prevotella sp.]|nr:hypothetical protein [Prevotella sp.]
MKRITSLLTMALVAMLSFTFVSCDQDDDDIAWNLQGIWEGEVRGHYYDRYGHGTTYNYARIEFYQNPNSYASGEGREIDFSDRSYYTEVVHFYFTVERGTIYISYDDGTDVAITNYHLFSDEFTGEFRDYHNGRTLAYFNFARVNSWRTNWNSYYDRYDWW